MAIDGRQNNMELSRRGLFGLGATAALFALAGCSANTGSSGNGRAVAFTPPKYVAPESSDGLLTSSVKGVPPMVVKQVTDYVSAFSGTAGTGDAVSALEIIWGAAGVTNSSNLRLAELEKQLNVKWDPIQVPDASFDDKVATLLASGNIPDLNFVDDTTATVAQAIQDGAFADLTETLAGDGILKYPNLAKIDPSAWQASAKNGRIYGIPNDTGLTKAFPVIRTDLMAKVGYSKVPDNAADFGDMLVELTKIGTYRGTRLTVNNTLNADQGMAQFKAMFRLGTTYQLNDQGKIVPLFMNDGYVDFIQYMVNLWKKGVFNPDTFSSSMTDTGFGLGQEILCFASFSGFYWAENEGVVNTVLTKVPGASVTHFVMPGIDGKKAIFEQPSGYWCIVGLNAKHAKDPKKLDELLKICDYFCSPYNSKEQLLIANGVEGKDFKFGPDGAIINLNRPGHASDGSATNLGISGYPVNNMPIDTVFMAHNVMDCLEGMVSQSVKSPVAGMVNNAEVANNASLQQIQQDYENGMVTGRRPVSAIDEYRKTWLASGGQAVLDEYQKLYDTQQKKSR